MFYQNPFFTNMMTTPWITFPLLGSSFFILVILLEIVLKGFALWKAARHNQPYWFVALLALNTLGILPAIYLIFFQPKIKVKAASRKR